MSATGYARLCAALAMVPFVVAASPEPARLETISGKVVRLADVVAKAGGRLDADAAPYWLALASDDGKLYPLIKDEGSRLFYKDPALLDRPVRVTGHLISGSTLLRVTLVRALHDGENTKSTTGAISVRSSAARRTRASAVVARWNCAKIPSRSRALHPAGQSLLQILDELATRQHRIAARQACVVEQFRIYVRTVGDHAQPGCDLGQAR